MRMQASGPPVGEAALDLVGPLPDLGEPQGLRLAEGELVRPRDEGGDHNGSQFRQECTVRGSGGGIPVCPFTGSSSRSPDPSQRRRRPADFGRFDTRTA